jgi:flagellar basal-body rod protein FlgF
VRQGEAEIGRLRLTNFEDPQRLYQDGNGYWIAPRGLREAAHEAVVHQGALEQSNATAVEELVAMIAVQRAYDSAAKTMSSIADSYGRLTRPF